MRIAFKSILLSVAILLLAGQANAQTDREDVVYLKNGSIYRGTLIEQIPNVSYKIEIAGGSVIVIPATAP